MPELFCPAKGLVISTDLEVLYVMKKEVNEIGLQLKYFGGFRGKKRFWLVIVVKYCYEK